MKILPNIHPGNVLQQDFLLPLGIGTSDFARSTGMSLERINEIVCGKRAIVEETAICLAAALGTSDRFWLGLQNDYDAEESRGESAK